MSVYRVLEVKPCTLFAMAESRLQKNESLQSLKKSVFILSKSAIVAITY